MTRDVAKGAATAVTRIAERMAENHHLAVEMQRARREFFGRDDRPEPRLRGAADTAELRFHEWVILERSSELLGAVPIELPAHGSDAEDVAESVVGVFVVGADAGPLEAQDLQDDAIYELDVPADSLQPGDLIVGRLYASETDTWQPSVAAAVFRPGAELAAAFTRDVQRLGLDRRLQQVELEHLLLARHETAAEAAAQAAPPAVPIEHLEADLDRLLRKAGSDHAATAISEQLAAAARPGPVLGPLLDGLAFDTDVDLDRARELLLELWNAHHAGEAASPTLTTTAAEPAGETLGERLVRTLDEGLRQKRDVEDLFAQLERMAGIEPDEAEPEADTLERAPWRAPHAERQDAADHDLDDDDELDEDDDDELQVSARDDVVPPVQPVGEDFGGDLEPLVVEYLWESGLEQDAQADWLRLLIQLQQNAPLPRTDLELVTGDDLLRMLLHVYLGAAPRQRAAAVRAAHAALRGFYAWAARTQEFELDGALQRCSGPLLDQLERLDAAGALLSTAHDPALRPRLFTVEAVGPRGFGVRDDDDDDHWLTASSAALAELRAGDLVLGALGRGAGGGAALAGLVVVMPAEVRPLLE